MKRERVEETVVRDEEEEEPVQCLENQDPVLYYHDYRRGPLEVSVHCKEDGHENTVKSVDDFNNVIVSGSRQVFGKPGRNRYFFDLDNFPVGIAR